MQATESTILAFDATNLFVRSYQTASSAARRTIVIVHGMSEHGARYDHVAQRFVANGWNVVVGDMRGHGRSGGTPTHVESFEDYLRDLDQIWSHFDLAPSQTVVLGHSFGGLISARFAQTRPTQLTAVALMSPLMSLNVRINPMTYALGRAASVVAPKTRFQSRIDPADTTRNQEMLEQRATDPLVHRSVTAGWFFQMRRALKAVWRDRDQIQVPALAMQAALDRIVDPTAVEPWLEQVGPETTFELKNEHYHELLNEPDWPETADRVLSWFNKQVPVSAASAIG